MRTFLVCLGLLLGLCSGAMAIERSVPLPYEYKTDSSVKFPTCAVGSVLSNLTAGGLQCVDVKTQLNLPASCASPKVIALDSTGNFVCSDILAGIKKSCGANQAFTSFDGVSFTCGNVLTDTSCPSGQAITSVKGGTVSCISVKAPSCAANEVLTGTSDGSFACKNITSMLPNCSANEALTQVNGVIQCVSTRDPLPNCAAGTVLTANGSKLSCTTDNITAVPDCATGQYLTGSNGKLVCVTPSSAPTQKTPSCTTSGSALTMYGSTMYCVYSKTSSTSDGGVAGCIASCNGSDEAIGCKGSGSVIGYIKSQTGCRGRASNASGDSHSCSVTVTCRGLAQYQ